MSLKWGRILKNKIYCFFHLRLHGRSINFSTHCNNPPIMPTNASHHKKNKFLLRSNPNVYNRSCYFHVILIYSAHIIKPLLSFLNSIPISICLWNSVIWVCLCRDFLYGTCGFGSAYLVDCFDWVQAFCGAYRTLLLVFKKTIDLEWNIRLAYLKCYP